MMLIVNVLLFAILTGFFLKLWFLIFFFFLYRALYLECLLGVAVTSRGPWSRCDILWPFNYWVRQASISHGSGKVSTPKLNSHDDAIASCILMLLDELDTELRTNTGWLFTSFFIINFGKLEKPVHYIKSFYPFGISLYVIALFIKNISKRRYEYWCLE